MLEITIMPSENIRASRIIKEKTSKIFLLKTLLYKISLLEAYYTQNIGSLRIRGRGLLVEILLFL